MNTFAIEHHGGTFGGKKSSVIAPLNVKEYATVAFGTMPGGISFGYDRTAIAQDYIYTTNHITGLYLGVYRISTKTITRSFSTWSHLIVSPINADRNDNNFYFVGRHNNTGVLSLMCFNASLSLVWKRDEITGDNYFGNHLYNEIKFVMDANYIYVMNWYRRRVTKFNRSDGTYVSHGFYTVTEQMVDMTLSDNGQYLYCAPPTDLSKSVTVFKTSDMSVAGTVALNGTYTGDGFGGKGDSICIGVYKNFLHTIQSRGTEVMQHRAYRLTNGVPNSQWAVGLHCPHNTQTPTSDNYAFPYDNRGISNEGKMVTTSKGLLIPFRDGLAIADVFEKDSRTIVRHHTTDSVITSLYTNGQHMIRYLLTNNSFEIFEVS